MKGEFARTVNLTDVHLGWVFTRSVRNNAQVHVLSALKAGVTVIPFEVTGLDFDNGSEFLNHDVITWAAQMQIFWSGRGWTSPVACAGRRSDRGPCVPTTCTCRR